MATYDYLNKTGLTKLWAKAKAAFADKESTNTELAKKFELPSGGTTGQILTKTDTGVKWADPLSNSDIPSSYLYAGVNGKNNNTVLEGHSYKNFTISNKQINFNDPGMYLITMRFDELTSNYPDYIYVTLKTNKNYTFSGDNNVYTFIAASTSNAPAKISYSFIGTYNTQRVFFSIRKIQDDIANYIILNGKDAETLDVISGIGITQSDAYGRYRLEFSKNGTYKLSIYSVTSKDTGILCQFPQNSNLGTYLYDGDEIYFEINDISSDKLFFTSTSDGFTSFIITVEEV